MKILIISGFLGAGKTTFIKTMTRVTGRSFVIYENEYGASGIDTKILENENLSVWEDTEKCVCCTGKGDFLQSLVAISSSLDPDYLVVEPTGVASLCSIIENIRSLAYEKISVLSPVTIVDCVNWMQQKASMEDVWKDQISGAGTVVLSKTNKGLQSNQRLIEEIRGINPEAEIVDKEFGKLDCDFFLKLLDSKNSETDLQGVSGTESQMSQLTIKNADLPTVAHLVYILDLAVMGAFGKISRAKGFLKCSTPDEWVKFDLVQREWAITGMEIPDDNTSPVAVFIGTQLQKTVLYELFDKPANKYDYDIRHIKRRLHASGK